MQLFPVGWHCVGLAFLVGPEFHSDEFQNFVVEHALSQPIMSPTWKDPNLV